MTGSAAAPVLAARTAFLHVMSLLAGKWPHTLTLQPGGSSRALQASERIRLYRMLREFRDFLERTVFDDALERVAEIASRRELAAWAEPRVERADFARFLAIAADLELEQSGRTAHAFLSSGAYPGDGDHLFARGVHAGGLQALDPRGIAEDVSHAWYAADGPALPPGQGATHPQADKPGAYSWCKAPRLGGRVVETGALARQVVAAHPLALDLIAAGGGSVSARVIARLLELARLVPAMESWAQALRPGEPYHTAAILPDHADSVGLVEAARGSLGHWVSIRRGRLHNYQIIAPTTWNFSPRDAQGTPGAVEQALVGTPAHAAGGIHPAIYHVVRSFDPCMVCTVH
jgi:uptake hydrogenase large subunit